jgi:hypothetical protein
LSDGYSRYGHLRIRSFVDAVQDAPVAPETKGADFGYGFCMCLRLGGEKRQADAKHRRRGKLVHFIATESDPYPWKIMGTAAPAEQKELRD